jgi:ABC-2 type transport system ATP-binding protein
MQIQITELTKTYGRGAPPALDRLNLEIRHGTFGLLGPNGAGKTTLIKILSTQLKPTAGQVSIDGWDLEKDRIQVRRRLGYLPQHFGTYPQLTAWEFLDYMGRLAGLHNKKDRHQRIDQSLQDVGLLEVQKRRSGTFSGGMKRRLGIAQAILADPEFLIVDEPTVGLDPEERIRFRGILSRLSRDRAVIISTHIVGDISSTCEDLAVLRTGQLIFHGPPEDLVAHAEGKTWGFETDDDGCEEMSQHFTVVNISADGERLELRMVGDAEPPPGAKPLSPNLEDAYVYFMDADQTAIKAN